MTHASGFGNSSYSWIPHPAPNPSTSLLTASRLPFFQTQFSHCLLQEAFLALLFPGQAASVPFPPWPLQLGYIRALSNLCSPVPTLSRHSINKEPQRVRGGEYVCRRSGPIIPAPPPSLRSCAHDLGPLVGQRDKAGHIPEALGALLSSRPSGPYPATRKTRHGPYRTVSTAPTAGAVLAIPA